MSTGASHIKFGAIMWKKQPIFGLFFLFFGESAGASWGIGPDIGPQSPGLVVVNSQERQVIRFKSRFQPARYVNLQLDWMRPRKLPFNEDFLVYAGIGWVGQSEKKDQEIVEYHSIHFPLGGGYTVQDLDLLIWAESSPTLGPFPKTNVRLRFNMGMTVFFYQWL